MKHSIFAAAIASSLIQPVFAEAPRDVHKLCLSAVDYEGCVRVQSSRSIKRSPSPSQTTTKRGNICPNGYAYIADDVCQKVECRKVSSLLAWLGNNPIIAGKSNSKCSTSWTLMRSELSLGAVGKLKYTPDCPPGPPVQGWNSTCETIR